MLSKYIAPSVNTFAKYFAPFYIVTTLGGAIYGGNLGYKASLTAPNYKEQILCTAFGSIAGGLYGPAFVLLIPEMMVLGFPEFKIDYDPNIGHVSVRLIPEKRD
jgi:hypothetical protein